MLCVEPPIDRLGLIPVGIQEHPLSVYTRAVCRMASEDLIGLIGLIDLIDLI